MAACDCKTVITVTPTCLLSKARCHVRIYSFYLWLAPDPFLRSLTVSFAKLSKVQPITGGAPRGQMIFLKHTNNQASMIQRGTLCSGDNLNASTFSAPMDSTTNEIIPDLLTPWSRWLNWPSEFSANRSFTFASNVFFHPTHRQKGADPR